MVRVWRPTWDSPANHGSASDPDSDSESDPDLDLRIDLALPFSSMGKQLENQTRITLMVRMMRSTWESPATHESANDPDSDSDTDWRSLSTPTGTISYQWNP